MVTTAPPQPPAAPQGAQNVVYISFSAEINPHTTESLIALFANRSMKARIIFI